MSNGQATGVDGGEMRDLASWNLVLDQPSLLHRTTTVLPTLLCGNYQLAFVSTDEPRSARK